jgi:hypothetical protein
MTIQMCMNVVSKHDSAPPYLHICLPSLCCPLQLALALLLARDLLPGLTHPPELYDPCFDPVDVTLLQERLGFKVLEVDEQCGRRVDAPTFFYLPHVEVSNLGHM